jgi:hypothetical protein
MSQQFFDAEDILAGILRWVSIESPTYSPEAVNRRINQAALELAELAERAA